MGRLDQWILNEWYINVDCTDVYEQVLAIKQEDSLIKWRVYDPGPLCVVMFKSPSVFCKKYASWWIGIPYRVFSKIQHKSFSLVKANVVVRHKTAGEPWRCSVVLQPWKTDKIIREIMVDNTYRYQWAPEATI